MTISPNRASTSGSRRRPAPIGRDWQIWSAAMHLYAAACVEHGRTPFFDELRRLPERKSVS